MSAGTPLYAPCDIWYMPMVRRRSGGWCPARWTGEQLAFAVFGDEMDASASFLPVVYKSLSSIRRLHRKHTEFRFAEYGESVGDTMERLGYRRILVPKPRRSRLERDGIGGEPDEIALE